MEDTEKKKLSLMYRFLRRCGLNYSEEEYGQVTLWGVIKRVLKTYRDGFLLKFIISFHEFNYTTILSYLQSRGENSKWRYPIRRFRPITDSFGMLY